MGAKAAFSGIFCAFLGTLWADDDKSLKPVPGVPGAFQVPGGLSSGLAGDAPRVDGLDIFGMEYAHRLGRREPLRAVQTDLSDWNKAPNCPPDRALVDRKTGRLRFFTGHDPSKFSLQVTARYREMNGDNASGAWHGNRFFLTHWNVLPNLWAYDMTNPEAPRKAGEVSVGKGSYGFLALDSGLVLQGTDLGVYCVDARDASRLEATQVSQPGVHWLGPITRRYVAGWKSSRPVMSFQ